jgi:Sec-independent protein translocase protein TatA
MLALIGNLDTTELIVVFVAAILIFGRKLPQVAAQAGSQLGKLRRTLDSAWRDSGVDKEVREMQRSIESIRDAVPRDLSPASIARTAATEFQRRVERQAALTEPATPAQPSADEPVRAKDSVEEAPQPAPPGPTGWSAPVAPPPATEGTSPDASSPEATVPGAPPHGAHGARPGSSGVHE